MEHIEVLGGKWPALGLGTWTLTGGACVEAVEHALSLGYRHIDTATAYDNEEAVGRGLRRSDVPRSEVWVTTKIWRDDLADGRISRAIEGSLRRLDTDYVDLALVHWPPEEVFLPEVMRQMDDLLRSGKARHIGVSNFTRKLQGEAKALCPKLLTNQIELHPFLQRAALRHEADAARLVITAYSPLARGRVNDEPTLQEIASAHGKSPAQVTLRWMLQRGVVVVPKAASAAHREENLGVFDFALSLQELDTIESIDRGQRFIDPSWAPQWDDPPPSRSS